MPPPVSSLIVAAQLGLLVVLLAGTPLPPAPAASLMPAALLGSAGVGVGLAAVLVNPPWNFNIRPEVKAGARLVTHGIYRHVRHPIYLALLLFTAGAVASGPLQPTALAWRTAGWVALLAVLLVKLRREEHLLQAAFQGYPAYAARTARLLPGLY